MGKIAFEEISFLVVDGNENMRRILYTMLRAFGAKTIKMADNGEAGLQGILDFQPDILLTETKLPVLDGIEFIRTIRDPDEFEYPYLPIIALTAFTERKHVIEALTAGVSEFLCKPVSATDLYARVDNIVNNPKPFVRTASYFGPKRQAPPKPPAAKLKAEPVRDAVQI